MPQVDGFLRRVSFEFVFATITAIVGFAVFVAAYSALLLTPLAFDFAGDKSKVMFGILLGLPCGGVVGLILADRVVFGTWSVPVWPVLAAFVLGLAGAFLGLLLLDKLGQPALFLLPVLVATCCTLAYTAAGSLKIWLGGR